MRLPFTADVIWWRRDLDEAEGTDGRRRRRLDAAAEGDRIPITMMSIEVQYFGDLTRRQRRALCEEVIGRIELLLPDLLRTSDVTYRERRDRVCVLLPGTTTEDAEVVVARVRRAIDVEVLPTQATVAITLGAAGASPFV